MLHLKVISKCLFGDLYTRRENEHWRIDAFGLFLRGVGNLCCHMNLAAPVRKLRPGWRCFFFFFFHMVMTYIPIYTYADEVFALKANNTVGCLPWKAFPPLSPFLLSRKVIWVGWYDLGQISQIHLQGHPCSHFDINTCKVSWSRAKRSFSGTTIPSLLTAQAQGPYRT